MDYYTYLSGGIGVIDFYSAKKLHELEKVTLKKFLRATKNLLFVLFRPRDEEYLRAIIKQDGKRLCGRFSDEDSDFIYFPIRSIDKFFSSNLKSFEQKDVYFSKEIAQSYLSETNEDYATASFGIKIKKSDIKYDLIILKKENFPCYVTTACTQHIGLPDNCFELETLKGLRNWMIQKPQGRKLIRSYYQKAPTLVRLVNQHPKKDKIWKWSYQQIQKAVDLTIEGKYDEAVNHYHKTVLDLSRLIKN